MIAAHVLFGGLGGHGSMVLSLVRASRGEVDHRLAFVGYEPLFPPYEQQCVELELPFAHFRTGGSLDLRFHRAVRRWLIEQVPDVVFVHSTGSLPSALAARWRRAAPRVVVVEHQAFGLRDRRHRWATRLGLVFADHTVVLTEGARGRLLAAHPVLGRLASTVVIPSGVDVDRFVPPSPARPRSPDGFRIGMQSRVIDIKDHRSLVAAMPELLRRARRPVVLEIAGDGAARPALEEQVRSLGLGDHVRFLGALGEGAVIAFLQSLDVYVHASLGESLSTAVLQAMAVGLPVVASDVPGIHDVDGFDDVVRLVPAGRPAGYAEALARLLEAPEERARLGRAGRALVRTRYSSPAMWEGYRRLLARQLPPDVPLGGVLTVAAAAGLDAEGALAVWPSRAEARLAWGRRHRAGGRWVHRTGLLGGGGSLLARWALRQPPVRPVLARRVDEVRWHGPAPSSSVDRWLADVAGPAASAFAAGAAPVVLCRREGVPGRGVLALFERGARSPAVVAKAALDAAGHAALRWERQVLLDLEAAGVDPGAVRIPRPLGVIEEGGLLVAGFSALEGVVPTLPAVSPSAGALDARQLRRILRVATRIGSALASVPVEGAPRGGDALAAVLESYREVVRPSRSTGTRVADLEATLRAGRVRWRGAWQHGDLTQGNLLLHRRSPGAVDFELASPELPPWFDEVYAFLSLALYEPDQPVERRLLALLDPSGRLGPVARRWVDGAWGHPLPFGSACVVTAASAAVRSVELGRADAGRWTDLVDLLVRCDRLPAWASPRLR